MWKMLHYGGLGVKKQVNFYINVQCCVLWTSFKASEIFFINLTELNGFSYSQFYNLICVTYYFVGCAVVCFVPSQ